MEFYLAPMEGITRFVYRNAYNKYFGHVSKYFTPFIAPAKGRPLRHREMEDILPENNSGLNVVPQILTNKSEDFVKTASYLKELGYEEVNINLGCPSGTVVSKAKGAGLLYDLKQLDEFLYGVFEADIMKVSIKTRIGKNFPEEFPDILEIYRKYPISEIIIHPRTREDYYKNTPNMEMFELGFLCYNKCGMSDKVCYNGDIFSHRDFNIFHNKFPKVSHIMLGRGVVGNPFLIEEIMTGRKCFDADKFRAFHEELIDGYLSLGMGEKNVLFKMKELWLYMGGMFTDETQTGLLKKIKKANDIDTYMYAAGMLCNGQNQ